MNLLCKHMRFFINEEISGSDMIKSDIIILNVILINIFCREYKNVQCRRFKDGKNSTNNILISYPSFCAVQKEKEKNGASSLFRRFVTLHNLSTFLLFSIQFEARRAKKTPQPKPTKLPRSVLRSTGTSVKLITLNAGHSLYPAIMIGKVC